MTESSPQCLCSDECERPNIASRIASLVKVRIFRPDISSASKGFLTDIQVGYRTIADLRFLLTSRTLFGTHRFLFYPPRKHAKFSFVE